PAIKRLSELYVNAMEQRCDLQTISRHRYMPQDYANTLLLSIKLSQQGALNPFAAYFTGQTIKVADYKQRFTFIFSHTPVQIKKSLYVFSCALLIVVLAKGAISQVYAGQDKWQYPVANIDISSHYGHVTSFRKNRPHRGIDLVDAKGTSIVAAKTGKVIIADNKTMAAAFGNTIVIQHSNGWQSLYAHLDEISVTQGQWVKSGELIGKMGDSGKVTGTHLHFELAKDGQTVDPLIYLNEK
ncbi:MAG: peptidoglycan DD-metalloendopeptidase family protein, partial [Pseudomonadota bacterium]|nr:peptidoglycan DD-metalloendopeptidase family protein [Pseudomonadota bacterium]